MVIDGACDGGDDGAGAVGAYDANDCVDHGACAGGADDAGDCGDHGAGAGGAAADGDGDGQVGDRGNSYQDFLNDLHQKDGEADDCRSAPGPPTCPGTASTTTTISSTPTARSPPSSPRSSEKKTFLLRPRNPSRRTSLKMSNLYQ